MLITDHINLFPEHPLRGKNYKVLGTRFPDMSEAYSKALITQAKAIAAKHNIKVVEGVYAGTSGPTFETPAEYKYFRIIGADTVGMSTVPEVIVAKHAGMQVFGISVITDLGVPGKIVEISHEEVQEVGNKVQPLMTLIMKELVCFWLEPLFFVFVLAEAKKVKTAPASLEKFENLRLPICVNLWGTKGFHLKMLLVCQYSLSTWVVCPPQFIFYYFAG